ncbi:hypothetical protein Mal4_29080 [Maioricimonas rarisocia]|uniref:Uncharacterized protein n=2 Tax=Maioricimonas rarisocia TaxID=2528026 RepID=A0A517Z804_9PLAN|nr:hypothetical protein Mal4_29080 [Maioricimonas rarisocia]
MLTLLAVTAHAVFGCSWHHVHACECGEEVTPGVMCAITAPDHHHDHEPDGLAHGCYRHSHSTPVDTSSGDGAGDEHQHHEHEPCEEHSCDVSLTVAAKVKFSGLLIARLPGDVHEPLALHRGVALRATEPGAIGLLRGAPGLCARLQVWLL